MMDVADLIIRGGTVFDGTGGAPFEADIAVENGRIAAVGRCDGPAAELIEAKGKMVTPGFVDIHTHYDGQLIWSPFLFPSSSHSVTSVVTGNCGVGFAPCRPADHTWLIKLLEGVEDMPEVVLADGLTCGSAFPSSSPRSIKGRTTSTSASNCRTRRCACTSWVSGRRTARSRPSGTSIRCGGLRARRWRPALSVSGPRAASFIHLQTGPSFPPPTRRSWSCSPSLRE
jgi:Amidohydrolase family